MATPTHFVIGQGRAPLDAAVETVVGSLCAVERHDNRFVIQMPVSTASGSLIAVTVWRDGELFMVTDDGLALHEVLCAGASDKVFTSVAGDRCKEYGAAFDGGTMLFIRVSAERLRGAIIAMANLTRVVVDETIEHSFRAAVDRKRERFIKAASEAYSRFRLTEHAKLTGFSTATHEFDLLVERDGRALVFDYFSKSGNAVNSAYLKLSDISRLENGVAPIGVTPDPKAIGPKLTLIASVAKVISADADRKVFERLAA